MDKRKPALSIDYKKCLPCSGLICIGVCPQGILDQGDNKKPTIIDLISCNQCKVCVNLCPTKAITLSTKEKGKE